MLSQYHKLLETKDSYSFEKFFRTYRAFSLQRNEGGSSGKIIVLKGIKLPKKEADFWAMQLDNGFLIIPGSKYSESSDQLRKEDTFLGIMDVDFRERFKVIQPARGELVESYYLQVSERGVLYLPMDWISSNKGLGSSVVQLHDKEKTRTEASQPKGEPQQFKEMLSF